MGIDRKSIAARLSAVKGGAQPTDSESELVAYKTAKKIYLKNVRADNPLDDHDDGFVSGLDGINDMVFGDDLIEGVVPANALGAIIGNSNVGKTFLTTTMLKAVAAGLLFNGHRVEQGGALYVGSEGSEKFARRRAALYRYMDETEAGRLGQDADDYKVTDERDTFLSSFDFPAGKEPEKACAHIYRLACEFRARRGAFPVLIAVDHMLALQPKDATGYDWQNVLSTELKMLKSVIGCTLIVLIHENKEGGFFGSVAQRAAWDFAPHIVEERKPVKIGGKLVQQPTGRRFITSDKVRDGERHNEADVFTLVSRLLGFTPSGAKVTSAVLKFSGTVRVDPTLAVSDDGEGDDVPTAVERDLVKVKKDGSSEARALQLMQALQEQREDTRPDDPPDQARHSWAEMQKTLDTFRVKRCIGPNGKALNPLVPKGSDSKSAFTATVKFAVEREWLSKDAEGYAETQTL